MEHILKECLSTNYLCSCARDRIAELEQDLADAYEQDRHSKILFQQMEQQLADANSHQEYLENRQEGLVEELKECYEQLGDAEKRADRFMEAEAAQSNKVMELKQEVERLRMDIDYPMVLYNDTGD